MLSSDAKSLRQTIRLIHCLQKERGATCTAAAAFGTSSILKLSDEEHRYGTKFTMMQVMHCTRLKTDRALAEISIQGTVQDQYATNHVNDITATSPVLSPPGPPRPSPYSVVATGAPFREALQRIRAMIDINSNMKYNISAITPTAEPVPPTSQGGAIKLPQSQSIPNKSQTRNENVDNDGVIVSEVSPVTSTVNFRRIFITFNALILHIIHEKIVAAYLPKTKGKTSIGNVFSSGSNNFTLMNTSDFRGHRARANTSPYRPTKSKHHNMKQNIMKGSMNMNMNMNQDTFAQIKPQKKLFQPQKGKHARMAASADGMFYDNLFPSLNQNISYNNHHHLGLNKNAIVENNYHQQNYSQANSSSSSSFRKPPRIPVSPSSPTSSSNNRDQVEPNVAILKKERDENRIKYLFALLLPFVQLKESISIERGYLTTLLSISETLKMKEESEVDNINNSKQKQREVPVSAVFQEAKKMFNDLVLEIENQHVIIRKLRKKAREVEEIDKHEGYMWSISKLVEQSIHMSPELVEVHNLIRQDFDIKAFSESTTVENFWSMISFYIDRLHALELLIVEEIESCSISSSHKALDVLDAIEPHITAAVSMEDFPVSDPETAPSPVHSISSRNSFLEEEKGIFDRSLLLSALSEKKKVNEYDITPSEAQKVLRSMTSNQLKHCILSMFASNEDTLNNNNNIPEDDIFSLSDDGSLLENDGNQPEKKEMVTIPTEIEIKEKFNAGVSPCEGDWLIDLYQVAFLKRIGRGNAGTTYVGRWQNQQVAIKVAAMTQMGVDGWGTEVRSLQRLHHPNIIRLYGAIYNDNPRTRCLVLEYCDRGDLSVALKIEKLPSNFFERAASSMANGMAYLHAKNILHRDIKPANILVHGDLEKGEFMIKLTDFGLSTLTKSNEDEHTAETGTYRWMAPEIIRHEPYSYEADVYSFSIVAWQLLTRETPFNGFCQVQAAIMAAQDHHRPPFPQGLPKLVESLIADGWNKYPSSRPSFDTIVQRIEEIKKNLKKEEKLWLQDPFGHPAYNPKIPKKTKMKNRFF